MTTDNTASTGAGEDNPAPTPPDPLDQIQLPPSIDSLADSPSLFHPLAGAIGSMYATAQGVATQEHALSLVIELANAITADGIEDSNSSTVLLTTQARVLDQIFNRFVMIAFSKTDAYPREDALKIAMLAQRQSAMTVDRLKRHDARLEALKIRKMQKTDKRTERP